MTQGKLFEGYSVEVQQGSLARFDVEQDDEHNFKMDRKIVLVIAATVDVPSFVRTKDGGMKRVNKLIAEVVRVADGPMRDELIEYYTLVIPGEGLFSDTAPVERRVERRSPDVETVDAETGEVYEHPVPDFVPPAPTNGHRDPALAAFMDEAVSK